MKVSQYYTKKLSKFWGNRSAKDCVKPIEEAYAIRYSNSNLNNLVLRTDNGTQYIAKSFKDTVKLLILIFLLFNLLSSFFPLSSRNLFLNSLLLFHCFSNSTGVK